MFNSVLNGFLTKKLLLLELIIIFVLSVFGKMQVNLVISSVAWIVNVAVNFCCRNLLLIVEYPSIKRKKGVILNLAGRLITAIDDNCVKLVSILSVINFNYPKILPVTQHLLATLLAT